MNERDKTAALIEGIAGYDPEQLERRDLGEYSFTESMPLLREIHRFFNRIRPVRWKEVSIPDQANKNSLLEALLNNLGQIKEAKLNASLPQTRHTLQIHIATGFAAAYSNLAPLAGFELITSELSNFRETCDKSAKEALGQIEITEAELLHKAKELDDKAKGLEERLAAGLKNIESEGARAKTIVEQVEANAKLVGITNEATHFRNLAIAYGKGAKNWLYTSIGVAAVLVIFLLAISFAPTVPATTQQSRPAGIVSTNAPVAADIGKTSERGSVELIALIEAILPRFIVITILLTGLLFALRNYSAQRHNEVVNLHRQTALSSFQTFVTSSADTATKNTILIQATQAIYAPQPSGFLKSENEVSQLPQLSIIADLVRGGSGKTDK